MKRCPITPSPVEHELPNGQWVRLSCGHSVLAVDDTGRCRDCTLRRLPTDARRERRTPAWNEYTVPPSLLREHRTARWARLLVHRGAVHFVEDDTGWESDATPGRPVVIVPNRLHHIEPGPAAEFSVEFHTILGEAPAPS